MSEDIAPFRDRAVALLDAAEADNAASTFIAYLGSDDTFTLEVRPRSPNEAHIANDFAYLAFGLLRKSAEFCRTALAALDDQEHVDRCDLEDLLDSVDAAATELPFIPEDSSVDDLDG